ncbi:hypothetical protein OG753_05685 [Streptomyces sp. NBC_00029]|uniref:hypothetical protein n=1 Tax=Streptomyces sp. NBC_00029 TaxID=2903613 RepID=UPI00324E41BD
MAVDRGQQLASRCPNGGILITGQYRRRTPACEHGTVSRVLHLDLWRVGVFEDRPEQRDHAGAAGDGIGHREIPQERQRLDRRVEDSDY